MKYLFLLILSGVTFLANAQPGVNMQRSINPQVGGNREQNKNTLLNQSFWQDNRG